MELRRLTNSDGLTGLGNRRYFDEYLNAEWQRAGRDSREISMLMIDVDHFKSYNDTYGHIAGDEALKRVANTIFASCDRSTDLAARFGGEEFALVLPGTPGGSGASPDSNIRRQKCPRQRAVEMRVKPSPTTTSLLKRSPPTTTSAR